MNKKGFTLLETMVTVGILAILLAIAIPGISTFLPSYRLKRAVQDLYSNMQSAKMEAVRTNSDFTIEFDAPHNLYKLNGTKNVSLNEYGSGITFGGGSPVIGYADNTPANSVTFTSRGIAKQADSKEWVYIKNDKDKCFKVGTSIAGLIKLEKVN